MGKIEKTRRLGERRLMDYQVQYANPYKLLLLAGFVQNPWGKGMHIIECEKRNGFPARRLHAIVYGERISLHHDLSLKGRRHITSSNTEALRAIRNYIQAVDESFVTCVPHPSLLYRVKAKLSTGSAIWRAIMYISDERR